MAQAAHAQPTGAARDIPASAAPAAHDEAAGSLVGEIVVTAQKRSERLQDVPISISAIGGDAVQKQRLTQADDLASKVPNLQLSATVGEGTPIFALRGVSMSDYSLNQAGPVATYSDEVYKGNFALLGVALYDLERVEVLRGPQGTLYGKNTTGGAVNLISREPKFGATDGYLNIGYGNYDRREANGALNIGLTDTLAARFAFTITQQDGWFKNVLPGKPDLDGVREYGLRGSILWQPTPELSFTLRGSTSVQDPYNYGVLAQPGPQGIGAGVYEAYGVGQSYFRTGLGDRQIASDYTPRRHGRTDSVSLTTKYDLGRGLQLTSITSYDKGKLGFGEDNDGAPNRTLEIYYGDKVTQVAQDLRLSSTWQGRFNFILGAYYNREKVFNNTEIGFFQDVDVNGDGVINGADCAAAFPIACNIVNRFDQLKHSYALYSDMHYEIGSDLTVRGGLRFTHDDGAQTGLVSEALAVNGAPVQGLIPPTNLDFKSDNLSGKIGIDYKLSRDVLLYASYSRGYRARSFNAQAFFDPSEATIAKPELIDAFEVGGKTQLADRRITLNTSAFYYIYHDQQFIDVHSSDATQHLVNLPRSRIFGAEVELTARATDVLDFRAGLGLLSTRIEEGSLNGVDLKGNHLSNAPSISLNVGADLTVYRENGITISIHPEVSYVASQYFEVFNELKQNGYALLGGHIDLERGPLTLSVWGKNLTDKFYVTSRINLIPGFGYIYNHVGAPSTYGVSLGYKF